MVTGSFQNAPHQMKIDALGTIKQNETINNETCKELEK